MPFVNATAKSKVPAAPFQLSLGQFEINFPNGFYVSIINHEGSYTDNHSVGRDVVRKRMGTFNGFDTYTSNTVEVMVGRTDGMDGSYFFEHESVKGHIEPEELAALLNFVATMKADVSLAAHGGTYRRYME